MKADHREIFMGLDYHGRFPVLVPRSLFHGHTWLVGATGMGKTVMTMSLLLQLLQAQRLATAPTQRLPAAVIMDMKGDMALFQLLRSVAARNGQYFRYFTLDLLRDSDHFLPFASLKTAWRSPVELVLLVLEALGLMHGFGYGRSFYTSQSTEALTSAIKDSSQPEDFHALRKVLRRQQKGRDLKHSMELLSSIETLAEYPQLQPPPPARAERTIDFNQVLADGEIVYFWLPATASKTAQEVARLALFSLFTAAQDRQRQNLPTHECFTVVDECQRLFVSGNLDVIAQQARSANLRLLLTNQNVQDLKTHDGDLRAVIRTNTRVQLYLSTLEAEASTFADMSGEELVRLRSRGTAQTIFRGRRQTSRTEQEMEVFRPRLALADALRISTDPQAMMMLLGLDAGNARFGGRPVPVRTLYPHTQAQYEAFAQMVWPGTAEAAATSVTLPAVRPDPPALATEEDADAAREVNPPHAVRMDALISAELDALAKLYG